MHHFWEDYHLEYEVDAAPHYPDKVHEISVTVYTGFYKHNRMQGVNAHRVCASRWKHYLLKALNTTKWRI